MDFVQKSKFFLWALFTEILLENNVFYILERKKDFKWKKLYFKKGPKNGHFPMGLVHGFCPKIDCSRMGVFNRNYVRKNGFNYSG